MILTPAQKEIAKDTHRFRVLNAGRRFGKTILSCWEIFGKAVSKDNQNIGYIAPTYQQARDIAWSELKKICLPVAVNVNESRLEITVTTQQGGESTIKLRGWESVETLRGQKFDFLVLDEVAMMRHFWVNWQEVLRPTLTDTRGDALFISTPKGFNHFYDLYNFALEDDDYKSFHFTSYDNPNIPSDEIDKAKEELPEDRFAQEYLADFRKQEGLVYRDFQRKRHVFENLDNIQEVEYMAGIDFGFNNPTCVLPIKRDREGTYWVISEWYKTQQTSIQVAEYVAACNFNVVYPDPENPGAIQELLNNKVNVREVIKGKGSVEAGINKVSELLKQGKLRIHKSCVNLIGELETYRYPDKKPNRNEYENPVKENDHGMDALRYALMMNKPEKRLNISGRHDLLLRRKQITNRSAR